MAGAGYYAKLLAGFAEPAEFCGGRGLEGGAQRGFGTGGCGAKVADEYGVGCLENDHNSLSRNIWRQCRNNDGGQLGVQRRQGKARRVQAAAEKLKIKKLVLWFQVLPSACLPGCGR